MARKGSVTDILSLNEQQIKERSFSKAQLFEAVLKLKGCESQSKNIESSADDTKSVGKLLTEMNKKLDCLIAENSFLRREIESLKNTVKTQSLVIERHESELRKRNIIIRGVDEKRSVRDGVLEVMDAISIDFEMEDDADSAFRLGKQSDRGPRPIKLVLQDFRKKIDIMKAAKELRNMEDFKHVYINNDLTPLQQERDRLLRKRRNEERAKPENSGKSIRISKGALYINDQKIQDSREGDFR